MDFNPSIPGYVFEYVPTPLASGGVGLYINERLITSNKSIYIMGDFNIDLLHAETSCYAQDFLLSLQSFSFIPTIDKPTRVYNNSATLIDNILTNKVDVEITSRNIISDISDHYSQNSKSKREAKTLK